MNLGPRTRSSSLTIAAVLASACYGAPTGHEDTDEVVGARAELVQKRRAWLINYDRHCGVCFEAFELCEKGSSNLAEGANCEAALNACVRGGLITDADAGVPAVDAGSVGDDVDGAVAGGFDGGALGATDDPFDAGGSSALDGSVVAVVESDAATAEAPIGRPVVEDAGRRRRGGPDAVGFGQDAGVVSVRDGGLFVDPRTAELDATVVDAGAAPNMDPPVDPITEDAAIGPVRQGNAADRSALEQGVDLCLTTTQDCLDSNVSVQQCVGELRSCVRAALGQTFETVCATQVSACRMEQAPANVTRSVERLCEQQLDFGADAGR